jgi:phage terminase large subunit-like protein
LRAVGCFRLSGFRIIQSVDREQVKKSVIFVDKAGTHDGGACSAFVLMHMMRDETYCIEDVRRGQWSALERERRLLQMAQSAAGFCNILSIYVEQEPGSGGKESAEASVRMLKGFRAYAGKVTGSKEVRAEPYAAQVQGGNVSQCSSRSRQQSLFHRLASSSSVSSGVA